MPVASEAVRLSPRTVDVKALRNQVAMTQEQFAARFGFFRGDPAALERGDRSPQGPAVLLNVIDKNRRLYWAPCNGTGK